MPSLAHPTAATATIHVQAASLHLNAPPATHPCIAISLPPFASACNPTTTTTPTNSAYPVTQPV